MSAIPAGVAVAGAIAGGIADARTGLIPDALTGSALVLGVAASVACGQTIAALAGAASCGCALLALHALTQGRGIGLGDVKLAFALGAGLGPTAGAVALGAAFVAGGVVATYLVLAGRARRGDAIRFGPFLALGALVTAAAGVVR